MKNVEQEFNHMADLADLKTHLMQHLRSTYKNAPGFQMPTGFILYAVMPDGSSHTLHLPIETFKNEREKQLYVNYARAQITVLQALKIQVKYSIVVSECDLKVVPTGSFKPDEFNSEESMRAAIQTLPSQHALILAIEGVDFQRTEVYSLEDRNNIQQITLPQGAMNMEGSMSHLVFRGAADTTKQSALFI